ncbi:MAG: TPR repeat-containing protein [bacterium]|nr:MAG: TPR repeat-containing protein [bacterium]
MKKIFLASSLFVLSFFSIPILADTIVLKDGRTIKCDTVREEGDVVRYWIGEASLTISRDKVERIERDNQKGEALTSSNHKTSVENTPNFNKDNKRVLRPILRPPIIKTLDGTLNIDTIEKLEASLKNNPQDKVVIEQLVSALNVVAFTEREGGNALKAKEFLNRALNWQPDNMDSLIGLASLEIVEGLYSEAAQHANKAISVDQKNQLAYYYLGLAYYNLEELPRAVNSWQAGLRLGEEPVMRAALTKAEKELALSNDFSSGRNRFFNLVLEGGSANLELESQLLIILEESHSKLKRQFDFEPKERISAIFYTKQTFSDITRAPSWAGAINDGKLRVPIGGLTGVNAELAKTITHELTHSFVYFKSRRRFC